MNKVQLSYRMPAEWEPHSATWLAWPHNPETWPGKMGLIPPVWVRMIEELTHSEKVHLLVNSPEMEGEACCLLKKSRAILEQVVFFRISTDDCWMRDAGPIFVKRDVGANNHLPLLAVTNWIFNTWGGKYPPWDRDNEISEEIARKLNVPSFEPGIVLEGGSIDVNGHGSLLTTESCLLNKNRNPHLSKQEMESFLQDYLGVQQVLWLGDGIKGDDTDGHVDDLSRFTGPQTLVTAVEEDPKDENHKILQDNLKRLKLMKSPDGRPFEIIALPMPGPVFHEDQRLPVSYANFYIANTVVLVPTFRHANDKKALNILQKCFPKRRIVGIDATDLICGLGGIHCVTQQQPTAAKPQSKKLKVKGKN